ncbi:MAG: protease inhibitor I42 family protein [Nitrospirota bacterium]
MVGIQLRTEGPGADPDRDARPITAMVGGSFQIHLWEDRTRGEQWVPSYDPQALVLVSDEFLRTTSNNAVDSGRRTFEFRSLASGTHRLVFEKRMGWKFTAEDRRVFLVRATDGALPAGGTGAG